MGQNSSPQTDSPKIVLFDLDDNLHEAEIWLFLDGLRHIFRAVGYEWRPYEKGADATLLPIKRERKGAGFWLITITFNSSFIKTPQYYTSIFFN